MKFSNIESYEFNLLSQMVEDYNSKLKKSKGVDPDFGLIKLKIK